jgi:hypothetical protein
MAAPEQLGKVKPPVKEEPNMLVSRLHAVRRTAGRMLLGLTLGSGVLALTALPDASPAGAASCQAAGTSGLTAAVVTTTVNQTINTPSIDATGCDVGIYVNMNGATITGVTVSGANDEGILAEDVSGLTVTGSTIQKNNVSPNAKIPDSHALMLDGVTGATITGNIVTNNNSGGIGLADNGPTDPGTPNAGPASPVASTNNAIIANNVSGNTGGCAIIVEAWNAGGGITGTTVTDNTVTGHVGVFGAHGPDIGQIVVADDAVNASISGTTISGNQVNGSFVSGITLHANAPQDVIANTSIVNNGLSDNNWGFANGAPSTDAIALITEQFPGSLAASISGTSISGNTITDQVVAIWNKGATTTTVGTNAITLPAGGTAVFNVPMAGAGYTLAGSDGGAFAFGDAGFHGSAGSLGLHLAKPIVAVAPSRDRGGYWELGADGGVLGFGDAYYYGSVPGAGAHVSNIVGFAPTPTTDQGATNGLGYWIVGSDGGVFAFGDAKYYGSVPGLNIHVNDIVGIVATSDGLGYWLVGSDGGVFAFGDAASHFHGSIPGLKIHVTNIVGMASSGNGGYLLVGSDGGVFAFGDASYHGSVPGLNAHVSDVVGIAPSPDGGGYTLAGSDGGVFSFGDVMYEGSLPQLHVNVHNVVGLAST